MKFNLVLASIFVSITTVVFMTRSRSDVLPENPAPNGSQIYTSKCIRCHNANPEKDGTIGPAVANSSYELIYQRTQFRSYPPGYKPKRKTKIMPKVPLTEAQIKALEMFLRRE